MIIKKSWLTFLIQSKNRRTMSVSFLGIDMYIISHVISQLSSFHSFLHFRIAGLSRKLKNRFDTTHRHTTMLIAQLDMLVHCLGPDESILTEITRKIGVRHAYYDISQKDYLVLAESIMNTLSHFLGPEKWSKVQFSWNALLQYLLRAMKTEAKLELRRRERLLQQSKTMMKKHACDEDSGHTDSSSWDSTTDFNVSLSTIRYDENLTISRVDIGKSVSMRSVFASPKKTPYLSHVEEEIVPLYSGRPSPMRSKSSRFRRDNSVACDTPPSRSKSDVTFPTASGERAQSVPFSPLAFMSPKGDSMSPRVGFFNRKTPMRLQPCKEEKGGRCFKGALDRVSAIHLAVNIASPRKASEV
jgi:hemoglobin-like flavoprotein